MNTDNAITTRGLTKRYRDVVAVDGLDLEVRRGEIYGFLGQNGAGKTTTIRMLLGLVRPSAGEVRVLGTPMKPGTTDVLARVGFLVETATAYPNLTVRENLEIQRLLTGSPHSAVDDVITGMQLASQVDRRAGVLSLGNKQRLSLARALLHHPEVLLLDEPANALDPAGIVEIRKLLRSLAGGQGVTVFISSHILAEIAHLADRIGIVHHGRLIEEIDREELHRKARPYVEVEVNDTGRAESLLAAAGLAPIERADGNLKIFHAEQRVPEIARILIGAGLDLSLLTLEREDLESYFLRRTGGEG